MTEEAKEKLEIVPITLKAAKEFIAEKHRHNKPPVGWKFGVGLVKNGELVGVGTAGRPVARHFDDGLTIEINRTCTNGTKNANSMIYGALWRASKALGYKRGITYTRADESGASLKAANWSQVKNLKPRGNWAQCSVKLRAKKDASEESYIERVLWEILA